MVTRVIVKDDMVYSRCERGSVKAWSIRSGDLIYEIEHESDVEDIIIGRKGTPLENRLFTMCYEVCQLSNLETGTEMKKINFEEEGCNSLAIDQTQTVIAISTYEGVAFIETSTFTKVKELPLEYSVDSFAFNKSNDCLVATINDEIHTFKFG